jgi:hypothetical protein
LLSPSLGSLSYLRRTLTDTDPAPNEVTNSPSATVDQDTLRESGVFKTFGRRVIATAHGNAFQEHVARVNNELGRARGLNIAPTNDVRCTASIDDGLG